MSAKGVLRAFCISLLACNCLYGQQIRTDALIQSYARYTITSPPAFLKADTSFYRKYCDAQGIPVLSSDKTPYDALLVARDIVNYMLAKRTDIRESLVQKGARVLIIAFSEGEMDLPERRNWKKPARDDRRLTPGEREKYDQPGGIGSMDDRTYWNGRARGMGGTLTSCAEENLLGYPGTRYYGENILVHEFSHNIMGAIRTVDPDLYTEIGKAYEAAKASGMYKGQYAINTKEEYWAEGSQWWFGSNFPFDDGNKHLLKGRDDLKAYDPVLYGLFEKIYKAEPIPADVYAPFYR